MRAGNQKGFKAQLWMVLNGAGRQGDVGVEVEVKERNKSGERQERDDRRY